MSCLAKWMAPLIVTIAGVALALALVAGPASPAVATAADEVPATAQVGVAGLNEQAQGDETRLQPVQPQMMDNDGDFWNGWWVIMPIMMVLFWGGLIALVVWGVRQFTAGREQGRSPLDIAKERLAKGEITKEEFDRIRGDLA